MKAHIHLSTALLFAVSACDSPDQIGESDAAHDAAVEADAALAAEPQDDEAAGGSGTGGLDLAAALAPQTIVGGGPASEGEYPFMGYLSFDGPGGVPMCGLTLVAPRYVLTAAHCITDTTRSGISLPGDLTVVLGRTNWTNTATGAVHAVAEVIRHPRYTLDPGYTSNDLAVLRLSTASTRTPVEIAQPHWGSDRVSWLPGVMATAIGWGWTGTTYPNVLQEVQVPVASDATVAANYGSDFNPKVMVGAGYPAGGKDACSGDSGGPLLTWTATGWKQFGVVSWGDGCALANKAGIYTRISAQLLHRWLRAVIHETPLVGDFNGDGRDDIVTFTHGDSSAGPLDAIVSLSNGSTFGGATVWQDWWSHRGNVPAVGDFNNDGRDDIWSFTESGVWVALSRGYDFNGSIFVSPAGSTDSEDIGRVGDVNGDGRADAVLFAADGTGDVHVMLSTASGFGPKTKWHEFFAPEGETPQVADVNGDGRADIVTFTQGMNANQVFVALSSGSGFGAATVWNTYFALPGEVPALGRFNAGAAADIITFVKAGAVYVGLSNAVNSFGSAFWDADFGDFNDTYRVGDVNGDGRDDILRFTQDQSADVYVALNNGTSFNTAYLAHGFFAP
ncbi:trypsin-like serine protease [Nannocystis pusilla]|uniref:Trypsin-like serine protease n=1 Tax=Nannocystis pusilla TaxID=889268 RepID=A0ABS7TVW6_9BACT|nr:trypsin-like serine protease [Nannocystis pusilla]MBZ5712353.1 trypsin-like serine protease [Nannocystis pusilla]